MYIERRFTKIYPAKLLQQGDLYAAGREYAKEFQKQDNIMRISEGCG